MYIILSCSHSLCGKNMSYSAAISNMIKYPLHVHHLSCFHSLCSKIKLDLAAIWNVIRFPLHAHHFVIFQITMLQKQVLLCPNLEHDQISPACTLCHLFTHSAAKQVLIKSNFPCMYTGGHISPTRGFSGKNFDCFKHFF